MRIPLIETRMPDIPVTPPSVQSSVARRIKPKIGKNALSCIGISVLAAIVCGLGLLVLIVKTGAITIPYISKVYSGPKPARVVAQIPISVTRLQVELGSRFASTFKKGGPPPYVVTVSEGELSGALTEGLDRMAVGTGWVVEHAQVAVTPDGFEAYVRAIRGGVHLDVLARVTPMMGEGGLYVHPVSVQVGDFRIPQFVIRYFMANDLGPLKFDITDTIRFKSVHLRDGAVDLLFSSV